MKKMLAYHNDPKIRSKYLRRVRAHAKADEIVKGQYWEDGKGCAVGCTIHSDQHADYEKALGIPVKLAYLEDFLFERLPNRTAKAWPDRFLSAIKTGADLSKVYAQFSVWLLVDEKDGVIRFAGGNGIKAVRNVGTLWARVAGGGQVAEEAWAAARDAAGDAARDAAGAAAGAAAAAAWAAADAAWAAAWAAADAADAAGAAAWAAAAAARAAADAAGAATDAAGAAAWAAADAAWAAAGDAAILRQSEKLLELLTAAPVKGDRS